MQSIAQITNRGENLNEIQQTEIAKLETEIVMLKTQTAQNIIEIGRSQLGEKATLKQICNYIAPQIGIDANACMQLIIHTKGCDYNASR